MNPDRDALDELFGAGAAEELAWLDLPPGGVVVRADEGGGVPVLWVGPGPAGPEEWARLHEAHDRSGLWPLVLLPLESSRDEDFRPWLSGELFPGIAEVLEPEEVLAEAWARCADDEESVAELAPFGRDWLGLASTAGLRFEEPEAAEYAEDLVADEPAARLGLVRAASGAAALAAIGWEGPANHLDNPEVSAVLRSWEQRFGAVVVGVGFATLHLSVAVVPKSLAEALPIAVEHFAFCPDNVWQGAGTLAEYAEQLVGAGEWEFWWD
ncbi:DUF4253 domain-containing protein [Kitasatospora viridis]|uniref:DUF4253 domain-containing protein n=1 Tax=Kitasatospora viridis TaxID=281105 RepID=UPI001FE53BAC|nr:DUF4253 domain-containing protein [Kitasatospora viridis]